MSHCISDFRARPGVVNGQSNLPDVASVSPVDTQWVELTSKKAALKLEKLDTVLENYKSNSIKESIRCVKLTELWCVIHFTKESWSWWLAPQSFKEAFESYQSSFFLLSNRCCNGVVLILFHKDFLFSYLLFIIYTAQWFIPGQVYQKSSNILVWEILAFLPIAAYSIKMVYDECVYYFFYKSKH